MFSSIDVLILVILAGEIFALLCIRKWVAQRSTLRSLLMLSVGLPLFLTASLGILRLDGHRMKFAAQSFVETCLGDLEEGNLPPISAQATEDNKILIESFLGVRFDEPRSIELEDYFYGSYSFLVTTSDEIEYIVVLDGDGFMRPFRREQIHLEKIELLYSDT